MKGTKPMSAARLDVLIPPKPVIEPVVISEDEWWRKYDPLVADEMVIWDAVGDAINPYKVWTMVDTDNGGQALLNGFHIVNKIGYAITAVLWKDGEDITVTIDPIDEGATL